ncbi:hypothetical protein [Weissella koreensis]|uniref:P-type ATPase n=1 Tax=Weissella koreensis TaxID=165096 RepID=UPI001FA8B851|nr:hypothetical protein [Weissella koreensis]
MVKSGSTIPVDGVVVQGSSYVNEASITGESKPAHKKVLSKVFAGLSLMMAQSLFKLLKLGMRPIW